MKNTAFLPAILGDLLLILALTGCVTAPPETRPAPGDRVFLQLICPKSWQAGDSVILSVKLRVQGSQDARPKLLRHEDIPPDHVPHATLTFWGDTDVVKVLSDVALEREC